MRRIWALLAGAGFGACIMYLFDPQSGNRRRALVRDKLAHYSRIASERIGGVGQEIRDRSYGTFATLRYQLNRTPPSDDVLVARVRSKLGRAVTHPHAIEVTAREGHVVLRGPILASDVERTKVAVQHIPGVTELESQLDVHATPDGVSALQSATPLP